MGTSLKRLSHPGQDVAGIKGVVVDAHYTKINYIVELKDSEKFIMVEPSLVKRKFFKRRYKKIVSPLLITTTSLTLHQQG
jgi:hypothetical protein